jgi:hypothetical protein
MTRPPASLLPMVGLLSEGVNGIDSTPHPATMREVRETSRRLRE